MQLKEGENQEVYVAFSPRFERIWLESKKRLPEYIAKKPANAGLRSQFYALRLYGWAKSMLKLEGKTFRWRNSERFLACSRAKMRTDNKSHDA